MAKMSSDSRRVVRRLMKYRKAKATRASKRCEQASKEAVAEMIWRMR